MNVLHSSISGNHTVCRALVCTQQRFHKPIGKVGKTLCLRCRVLTKVQRKFLQDCWAELQGMSQVQRAEHKFAQIYLCESLLHGKPHHLLCHLSDDFDRRTFCENQGGLNGFVLCIHVAASGTRVSVLPVLFRGTLSRARTISLSGSSPVLHGLRQHIAELIKSCVTVLSGLKHLQSRISTTHNGEKEVAERASGTPLIAPHKLPSWLSKPCSPIEMRVGHPPQAPPEPHQGFPPS